MSQVSSLIKKHKINHLLRSKKSNLFTSLSQFIDQCFKTLPKITNQKQQLLKETLTKTIQQLQRQSSSNTQKLWIRLILIEMVFNKSDPSLFSSQIADLLNSLCKLKPMQLTVSDKISQGFFSFTSLLGLNKFRMSNPQSLEDSSLFDDIVAQISLLLRKKLSDWQFFLSFQKNQKQQELNIENQEHYKSYQQKVWKVINHLKAYNVIIKIYKSIQTIDIKMRPFMLATLHLLGSDIIQMYPSIVKLIQYQVQIVQQQYGQITNFSTSSYSQHHHRISKQEQNKLLETIYDSHIFIQLRNLIKQLQTINLTLMYIFYGIHHKNDLMIKLPKEFILNSGHVKLDFVHKIEMEVKYIRLCKSEDIKGGNINSQEEHIVKNLSQFFASKSEQMANSLQQKYVNDSQQNLNKKTINLHIDETQESESFIDEGKSDQNTFDQVVETFY